MKKILYTLLFICCGIIAQSQNATFITLSGSGQLESVTVGTGGCVSTPLSLCSNFTGSALSIALDGNKLYIVDNQGFLYKNTLTATGTVGNCTKIGKYPIATGIYGLTVGNGGIVYAASGSLIEEYNPTTNIFTTLGSVPAAYTIGGDLLFYKGILYMAAKVGGSSTNNALIQIDLANVPNSSLYMSFNAGTKVFGFASVTVPCSSNVAYALSANTSTTDIFLVDMINKTQATTATCTLNYNVSDAASVAETQSATPPTTPVVNTPYSFCQNQLNPTLGITPNTNDTLRWYKQAVGGTSYGKPTPAINTAIPASTNYYVSNFDTSTGCESGRALITVNVIATNPNPTINITSPLTSLCVGSTTTFTANATGGGATPTYLWYKNGVLVSSSNTNTYAPTSLSNNDTIKCTIISSANCVVSPSATSNNIIIKVISPTTVPLTFDSCKQVTYLGNIYYTNTTVKDTVKSVQGCDSIYHNVTIIIKQPTTSTTTINTTTPYTWNGTTYNTSGTYTKTGFINSAGCDSSATLILTITVANPCWKMISAAGLYTAAIKQDSTLWAWGYNNFGQLGDGTNIDKNIPTQIGIANNWASINAGGFQTIAIKTDGTLWAWGINDYGQLGDGTNIDKNIPTQIGTNNNWANISAGAGHTVAIKQDGTLWAWGENNFGQLGDGTNIDKNIPTKIGTDNNWASIDAGGFQTIAIKTDGTLWAWGNNAFGELGDGTNINKNTPIQIGTSNNWIHISSGYDYSGAIKADGTLWAWGINVNGQLGDGTNVNKYIPTPIGTANNWASIGAGNGHTVALKTDGTLWAWGDNSYGQLGDGTNNNTNTPIQSTTNNWISISTTYDYTIALKADGTLWAWGYNAAGQLGDGTNIDKNKPSLIINGCNPCPVATTVSLSFDSCKQVTYLGKIYTVNAFVKDTVKNFYGCDSVYNTVNIIVNKPTNSNNKQAICPNQLPYSWNGLTFTGAGSQTKTGLTNSAGCDSSATLMLTLKTITISKDSQSICPSQLPYSWNGLIFTTAGTQTKTGLVNSQGCDSTATLVLTLKTVTVSKYSQSICPSQLPYSWNGLIFTTASTKTKTGLINSASCDSSATLVLTVKTNTSATFSKSVCPNQLPYTWNGLVFTKADTLTKTGLINSQGCDSSAVFIISVKLTINSTATQAICPNQLPYNWNGFIFTKADTLTKTGLISSAGCDSIATFIVNIKPNTQSTNSKSICPNQLPYSWNSLIFTKADTQTKTGLVNSVGCDSSATLMLTVYAISSSTTSQSICANLLPYSWNGLTFTIAGTQTKTGLVNSQGCDSSATLQLSITKPITVTKFPYTGCQPFVTSDSTYSVSTVVKEIVKSNQGCDSVYYFTTVTIIPVIPTTHSDTTVGCKEVVYKGNTYKYSTQLQEVTTKSVLGCDSIYNFHIITVYPNPTIRFEYDSVYVFKNDNIVLQPLITNSTQFRWSPTIYLGNDTAIENPICTPLTDTKYKIVVTGDNGCQDSSYVKIIIAKPLSIPNVFSPNGDNVNDTWVIDGLEPYKQNTVQIFNRWGQKVYGNNMGMYIPFNGKLNGKDLPFGVYYYIIKLSPELPPVTGSISILR
jgi:gliding motility-associated-like protein